MAEIELANGEVAIVDDADLDFILDFARYWHLSTSGYATARGKGHKKMTSMHRLLMGVTDPKQLVDHTNGDKLDNRRGNLRLCTNAQNIRNQKIRKDNTSGFKGVSWAAPGRYVAKISFEKKQIVIGSFSCPKDAARAYNAKALELHGEFARLNPV
jgi:hypothetical protein